MALSLLPIPIECSPRKIVFDCMRLYLTSVRCLTPFKRWRSVIDEVTGICVEFRDGHSSVESILKARMNDSTSLEQYETRAKQLDIIEQHERWKDEETSTDPDYEPDKIKESMQVFRKLAESSDVAGMVHRLRTGLTRNLGGMDDLRLYKHSWSGTKHLIEEYIQTVVDTIEACVRTAIESDVPTSELFRIQRALEDSLKFYGRTALTLSGGARLGMKHIGVAKTLWETGILPQVISGASAGSIVAAIVGSAQDADMEWILNHFPASNLAVFDPKGTGRLGWFWHRVSTFCCTMRWFRVENLQIVMKEWLKETTFREAYNKTGRVINICVSGGGSTEPRLLNHITAPHVYLWSAVCASCSVPVVFPAANIYEKDPVTKRQRLWMSEAQQPFVDGSLDADIPVRKLSEMFDVNFFIVSQVNPHVRGFLTPEEVFDSAEPKPFSMVGLLWEDVKDMVAEDLIHRGTVASEISVPTILYRWISLMNQQYTGHVNVLPKVRLGEYFTMMANPSPDFMLRAQLDGERATWPRMCRIRNCLAIEIALVDAIHTLRELVNFSPEAREARRHQRARISDRGRVNGCKDEEPLARRRRSLSNEHHTYEVDETGGRPPSSNPPTPGISAVRRNLSLSHIERHPELIAMSAIATSILAPQAGVDFALQADTVRMNGHGDSAIDDELQEVADITNSHESSDRG